MRTLTALLLAAVMLFTGCAAVPGNAGQGSEPHSQTANPPQNESGNGIQNLSAAIKPAASSEANTEEESLDTAPMVEFSLALLRQAAAAENTNTVISPASAYLCLALVQNGADGDTLAQMAKAMGVETDALNALCSRLTANLQDTAGSTKLSIANSVWADDDGVTVTPAYLQAVADHYGADIFSADLPSKKTLDAVNAWVNDKTNGLIPKLHSEPYPESTLLVLLNSLYFKAKWNSPFNGDSTFDEDFKLADGTIVKAPFMHDWRCDRRYLRTKQAQGVALPYDDGKTVFLALKPVDCSAAELAQNLSPALLSKFVSQKETTLMNLTLPKFTVEYGGKMNDMLIEMGMKDLFDPNRADLSRMGTGNNAGLYIDQVFQKVKIIVDEEGTEAAAVTEAAAMEGAFLAEEPVEMKFDCPFVYAVVDIETQLPLFIGVMDDPTK